MSVENLDGLSVREYAQFQTLHPKPHARGTGWYTGYDTLVTTAWDFGMTEFPLDVRYADFKRRLNEAMR